MEQEYVPLLLKNIEYYDLKYFFLMYKYDSILAYTLSNVIFFKCKI